MEEEDAELRNHAGGALGLVELVGRGLVVDAATLCGVGGGLASGFGAGLFAAGLAGEVEGEGSLAGGFEVAGRVEERVVRVGEGDVTLEPDDLRGVVLTLADHEDCLCCGCDCCGKD